MGAWGPAVFSDDLAEDVRSEYRELLEDGVADDDAMARVIESNGESLDDPDDGPVFWLALAMSQSKVGRLDAEVRRRAVDVIDQGLGLERWEEGGPEMLRSRTAALAKARAVLVGPQPERRKIRPPSRTVTQLEAGDVLALHVANRAVLIRVLRIDEHRLGAEPVVVVLDYRGAEIPSAELLSRIPDHPRPERLPHLPTRIFEVARQVMKARRIDFDGAGFKVIGRVPPRPGDDLVTHVHHCCWDSLEGWFAHAIATEDVPYDELFAGVLARYADRDPQD